MPANMNDRERAKRPWYGQYAVNHLEFFSGVIPARAWLAWVCQLCGQETTEENWRGKSARREGSAESKSVICRKRRLELIKLVHKAVKQFQPFVILRFGFAHHVRDGF